MPHPSTHPAIRRVAIVGAGTIGASWAALFLAHGLEVVVSDPAPDAEPLTRERVRAAWPVLAELGRGRRRQSRRAALRARPGGRPEGRGLRAGKRSGTRGLQDRAIRAHGRRAARARHRRVQLVRPDHEPPAIRLCAARALRDRPSLQSPHLIPLVEVVGGKQTSEETIERAIAFYRELGKYPIRLNKEVPGHIANRLQAAVWREAIHLAAENVASVADIDAAVSQGPPALGAVRPAHDFQPGRRRGRTGSFHGPSAGTGADLVDDLGAPEVTPELRQRRSQASTPKPAAAASPSWRRRATRSHGPAEDAAPLSDRRADKPRPAARPRRAGILA